MESCSLLNSSGTNLRRSHKASSTEVGALYTSEQTRRSRFGHHSRMTTDATVPGQAAESTMDERWAAWVARGATHDRKVRKRWIAFAGAVGGGLAVWLAIVLIPR